jgi:TonB family protein
MHSWGTNFFNNYSDFSEMYHPHQISLIAAMLLVMQTMTGWAQANEVQLPSLMHEVVDSTSSAHRALIFYDSTLVRDYAYDVNLELPGGWTAFYRYFAAKVSGHATVVQGSQAKLSFLVSASGMVHSVETEGASEELVEWMTKAVTTLPRFPLKGMQGPPYRVVLWIENADQIFKVIGESAVPQGGLAEFYSQVDLNLRYPEPARKKKIQGRVFVEFVVERDGRITHAKVLHGLGYGCDEEALRLLRSSPRWLPGKMYGRPQRQQYVLPIQFGKEK